MHEAFIYDNEGKTIKGYKGYLGDKIKIPEDITHIADGAFYYNSLTKVYIENTHVTIGKEAFSKNPIESFIIKGLTQEQIMKQAFIYDNEGKTIKGYKGYLGDKIKIPEDITHIGEKAFSYNSLTELHLSDSVTHIGESAFTSNKLKELHLSDSVTHIGNEAFYDNSLTELHLSDSVTHIGNSAFSGNKLEQVVIGKNVKYIGDNAFEYQDNKLQRLIIFGNKTRFNDRWSNIGFPKKLMPKV
jgi:hypothetical protein